jgi:hypothetical protein
MPENLTAGGKPVPASPDPAGPPPDPEFARAMAAPEPGQRPDYPGPRKRDAAAPHGRDSDGKPLAPYGYKPDGTPRQVAPGPGRGKTGDRVQPAPGAKKAPPAARPPAEDAATARGRRAADAQATLELLSAGGTLWAMFALTRSGAAWQKAQAKNDKALTEKYAAAYARAQVTQLDAAAFALHAEGVGESAAAAAAANAMAAALVDHLALVNGIASVGIAVLPLAYQLIANHSPAEVKDDFPPELLSLGVLPPKLLLEKLQAANAVKMARAQSAILAEKQEAEAELERLRGQTAA